MRRCVRMAAGDSYVIVNCRFMRDMKGRIFYAVLSAGLMAFLGVACCRDVVRVVNPRCEMQVNPVGLSAAAPHLSWELISGERGVEQRFYRILVASSEENLDANRGDKWDSGWVRSDESVYIPYGGAPLRSRETCFWKVRVKTGKGCSAWSQPAAWTMGFMDASAWEARWIGLDRCFEGERTEGHTRLAARYFRKEFDAPGEVRRAVLYISGLGLYEAYINGKRIGTQVLAQAPTDYDKTVFYNVFDVTETICPGENALGVVLGNGRYVSPRNPGMRHFGFPKMFLQLELEYADGTCRKVVSDDSWRATAAGPIRANNEFDGEEYDARMEMPGWNEPGYADEAWLQAETVAAPGGKLTVQTNPMIEIMDTVRPVAIARIAPGVHILDMGQNMVGWLSVNLKGKKGKPISMKFAELLQKDGSLYLANLRTAQVTDIYTPAEDGDFSWQPRFVYHGFRFVEVSGLDYKPELSAFTGHVIYDEMATTGRFETSNPLVNQIHKNSYWGIRSNYRGMPTDCPQRDERLGWLGDRATGAYGEAFIFNNAQLYNKWLQDIEDSMSPEGSISDVSPNYWTIYADDVTWPSAFFYVTDMLYRQFGDDSAIRAHYPAMKRWMAHMEEATMKDYIMTKDQYGDWCMPPESQELIHSKDPARKTDGAILSTTVYYDLLNKMIGFARICGQDADISGYESLAAKIKAAYNAKFFNKETAEYGNNTVTANILSLRLGLVPEGYEGKVFSNIVKKTEEDFNGHVSTGVLGIQHLMRGLTEYGRVDMAYKILTNETYPSWGYMIKNGATTIWELWNGDTADPAMNSANHVMLLGDLLIWYYEDLAGIKCAPDAVGFKKLVMEPVFPDGLDEVSASYGSVYGEIKSAWTKKGGDFSWDITLPGNTSAIVRIPKKYNVTVGNLPGVRRVSATEGYMEVEIGSGSYHFGK